MKRLKWSIAITLLSVWFSAAARADLLQNGGFEEIGDPPPGWQVQGNVEIVPGYFGNHMARLNEANSGGLSRIYQTFDIPASPAHLTFVYKMLSSPTPDPASPVPPDSFSAFLIDSNGARLLGITDPPTFSKAFLYQDSSGVLLSSSYVTVTDPDEQGVCIVDLDLGSAPQKQRQATQRNQH